MRPTLITFTGLDERTDMARVAELSSRYLQMQREPWRADVREAFAAALAFVRAMDSIRDKAAGRAPCAS